MENKATRALESLKEICGAESAAKIIVVYDHCYCGIPKAAENLPASYCECSAGWSEQLFSSVFGKDVTVKIRQTILGGADSCIFEVTPKLPIGHPWEKTICRDRQSW